MFKFGLCTKIHQLSLSTLYDGRPAVRGANMPPAGGVGRKSRKNGQARQVGRGKRTQCSAGEKSMALWPRNAESEVAGVHIKAA